MEIIRVVIFCFTAVVMLRLLRKEGYAGYAILLSTVVGILVFLYVINHLKAVLTVLKDLTAGASINFLFLDTLLKVVGIAYIAEFGSQICRDADEGLIAGKVEFVGKILILILAVPIILLVMESIINFLP
jgi:stage III sporulation protein AD